MAGSKTPGPTCSIRAPVCTDDGTSSQSAMPSPGPALELPEPVHAGHIVPPHMSPQQFEAKVFDTLKKHEGYAEYMYLDADLKHKNVTVGIGELLTSADMAKKLGLEFVNQETKKAASAEDVQKEFDDVKKLEAGRGLSYYYDNITLEFSPSTIKKYPAHLMERIKNEYEPIVRKYFVGYDDYPDEARLALIDMAFNLGPGLGQYTTLQEAAEVGDWSAAADLCHRNIPGDTKDVRNQWTKQQFLAAARATEQFLSVRLTGKYSFRKKKKKLVKTEHTKKHKPKLSSKPSHAKHK